MTINYRKIKYIELNKLEEINRKQKIRKIYRINGNTLEIGKVKIDVEKWNCKELREYISRLKDIYSNGGFIYSGFNDKGKLIGIVALDKRYLDENKEYIILDMVYISYEYRNKGIGNLLVNKALEEAKKTNAKYVYISSSNFLETVEFYKSLGAELTKPNSIMYKKEPEDIHMRIKL